MPFFKMKRSEFLKDTKIWMLPIWKVCLEGIWASVKVCVCFNALTQLRVIAGKLQVPEQPTDSTQKHGLLGRMKYGEHPVSYVAWFISIYFHPNTTKLTAAVYFLFTCCMSNLIVPEVLTRKDLAVVFLNTNAYPNLGFSSTEQNDKPTIAILRAIFHSCFSFPVILLNWRHIACGV